MNKISETKNIMGSLHNMEISIGSNCLSYYYRPTVDLAISPGLDSREFVILGLFMKSRIRELSISMIPALLDLAVGREPIRSILPEFVSYFGEGGEHVEYNI